ncbi:hypothetical protein C900_01610 [Fulvivirga imtechensis AK7]|uniref:Thioredoxin domain-containing protein n=1 Tax=Fulvivirga imtechensis AK7 TaxID=1237149 RepID=L8JVW1_9BACT|nr:DUF255 domain-containing protein [Fulvivirga imtechensis]ELR72328.1 hypothetical protein C900_01610 [Fulvivirga imtechensis AK7]
MKKNVLLILFLSLVVVFLGSSAFMLKNSGPQVRKGAAGTVNWMTFEEAVEKSKVEKKKIFIDVYTDWCGWCKVMDKNTFSEPEIAKYLNENFYPVKFDAEQEEEITFRDRTFKFVPSGKRGYHELAAALLNNKLSYPSVVFLDEDFNMIQPLAGYQKPDQFEKIVKYIGGDHFKTTAWQEWEQNFESKISQ